MFIRLTRQENDKAVLVNTSQIYEIITLPGVDGCELVFPHDKVIVKESLDIVEKLITRNL